MKLTNDITGQKYNFKRHQDIACILYHPSDKTARHARWKNFFSTGKIRMSRAENWKNLTRANVEWSDERKQYLNFLMFAVGIWIILCFVLLLIKLDNTFFITVSSWLLL